MAYMTMVAISRIRVKIVTYFAKFTASSMVSGNCLFSVSGNVSANRPATTLAPPNMTSGRAFPRSPDITSVCETNKALFCF